MWYIKTKKGKVEEGKIKGRKVRPHSLRDIVGAEIFGG